VADAQDDVAALASSCKLAAQQAEMQASEAVEQVGGQAGSSKWAGSSMKAGGWLGQQRGKSGSAHPIRACCHSST
jgi:hypothetical protein